MSRPSVRRNDPGALRRRHRRRRPARRWRARPVRGRDGRRQHRLARCAGGGRRLRRGNAAHSETPTGASRARRSRATPTPTASAARPTATTPTQLLRPGVADIADNGTDEDCNGVDATNLDRDGDGRRVPQDCGDSAGIRAGRQRGIGNSVERDAGASMPRHDLDDHLSDGGCAVRRHEFDPDRVRARRQRPDHPHPRGRDEGRLPSAHAPGCSDRAVRPPAAGRPPDIGPSRYRPAVARQSRRGSRRTPRSRSRSRAQRRCPASSPENGGGSVLL